MAGMEIRSLGLRGLTTPRAARLEIRNVPNPVMVTEFPRLSSFVTVEVRASSERDAARLVIPAASARRAMRSCFDMDIKERGKEYKNIASVRTVCGGASVLEYKSYRSSQSPFDFGALCPYPP